MNGGYSCIFKFALFSEMGTAAAHLQVITDSSK